MEEMSKFPQRLKELMEECDEMGAAALAQTIGVSARTVREWRSGRLMISLTNAVKIADCFGCSMDYLAGKSDVYEEVAPRELPPFYPQIRKAIAECGTTRYRVTADTSIKDSHFTNWQNGRVPKLQSVYILACYLNVSIDYLIGRRDF